jgi:hypothetical protein
VLLNGIFTAINKSAIVRQTKNVISSLSVSLFFHLRAKVRKITHAPIIDNKDVVMVIPISKSVILLIDSSVIFVVLAIVPILNYDFNLRANGCITQSFITTMFSMCSFFWTTLIAFNLWLPYVVTPSTDHGINKKIIVFYHARHANTLVGIESLSSAPIKRIAPVKYPIAINKSAIVRQTKSFIGSLSLSLFFHLTAKVTKITHVER